MDETTSSRLLSEFPAHTYEQWKSAATDLLKGRPFEKTLVTPTYEGFEIQPIYTREVLDKLLHVEDQPGQGSLVRGGRPDGYLQAGWLVSQELTAPTPSEMNRVARHELASGQTELNVWLDGPSRRGEEPSEHNLAKVGLCGVSLSTMEDLKELLEGIDLQKVSLYLQGGKAASALYALLVPALLETGRDPAALRGCLGLDPFSWLVESGKGADLEKQYDDMADILRHAIRNLPKLQVIDIQGHGYHNGGASSTQEMGAVLAGAVACLKAMQARGLKAVDVVPRMRLSLSVGGNYFVEVAKFRALRLLWSKVADAFGVPEECRAIHLHARTGLWNKTLFDPYVNMLRTTTEAFSAVVGGCDSLHVGPFDEVVRESDSFSRRIARNTHAILAEECDMRRVVDPAGGSWAVESLTDQMAAEAWKQLQEIEGRGGIAAVLGDGSLQAAIESTRQEKARNIQRRKDVIVGTNTYPNASEELLKPGPVDYATAASARKQSIETWKESRDNSALASAFDRCASTAGIDRIEALLTAAAAGATTAELLRAAGLASDTVSVQPIPLMRGAGDFEKLRLAAMVLAAKGRQPLIHQLNMGPSRRYRARADWTSAFFQVAGIRVLNDDDYNDVEEAAKALAGSGARVAVITSDDETYASLVEPLAKAIRAAESGIRVLLAGAPGDSEQAWREAGVDDFVHVRVNNYTFNRELLQNLGAEL